MTYPVVANNARTIVAEPYISMSGDLVVSDASVFPALGTGEYFIVSVGRGSYTLCHLKIDGVAGDTLSVAEAIEGTEEVNLYPGDVVAMTVTAGMVEQIHGDLDGKAAAVHNHDDRYYTEGEITTQMATKANISHTHTIANVTGLQTAIDAKAAKNMPVDYGTGTPSATTYLQGDGAWASELNTSKVSVTSTNNNLATLTNISAPSAGQGAGFICYSNDGVTPMTNGSRLGFTIYGGYAGTAGNGVVNAVGMAAYAAGNWTSTSTPSYVTFETCQASSLNRSERMRINPTGQVVINNGGAAAASTNLLAIKASASHTGNLQENQNSGGSVMSGVESGGGYFVGPANSTLPFVPGYLVTGNNTDVLGPTTVCASSSAAQRGQMAFFRTRGTNASPSNVVNNDTLGTINFLAYAGGHYGVAGINAAVDGTVTNLQRPPARLEFWTAQSNSTVKTRLMLDTNGQVVCNPNTDAATSANLLQVKASSGHTGDLVRTEDASGNRLNALGAGGSLYIANASTTASGTVALAKTSQAYQFINPNGSNRDVTLPSVSSGDAGLTFAIHNTASSGSTVLVVKDSGGTQVGVNVPFGATLGVVYDGSAWRVI